MPDERRLYQIENGTVYYFGNADHAHIVCQENELFAVLWDSDGNVLQKHGKADLVQARHDQMRDAFISGGFHGLAASLTIATFPATPETLEEVNACIEISNRVGKLEERLSQMFVPRSATMH
jgi:hypothetical protein